MREAQQYPLIPSKVQLVFDKDVLIDALLSRGADFRDTARLLEEVKAGHVEGWVASHTLVSLASALAKQIVSESKGFTTGGQRAYDRIRQILQYLKILPQSGTEYIDALLAKPEDYESHVTMSLARASLSQPLLVSNNKQLAEYYNVIAVSSPVHIMERKLYQRVSSKIKLPFIDLKSQQRIIRPKLEQKIQQVLNHGQYILGPEVSELEQKLAEYAGTKHCVGVASGTDALVIAMLALGVGSGDEVITTPFTFISTGEMIALLGARPVFVDIDRRTYNINPANIEAAITPKTKAILPVSLYGQCADMDAINAIAEKHGLPVIEDAAQSFGATYKGRKSCALSTIGCTSFFPSKPLGGYGDSGACFTDDDELAKVMREIRVHGQDKRYHHSRIGINGRLDTLQAAILLVKLETFPQEVDARQRLGQRYTELIHLNSDEDRNTDKSAKISPPYVASHNTSVYAQYTVQVPNRETVQSGFQADGIPTAVHYPIPLNKQPVINQYDYKLPHAEKAAKHVLSLPMHPYLEEAEQRLIIEKLYKYVQ